MSHYAVGNVCNWMVPAKRRFLYTRAALDLPVASRAQDPEHGLSFEFLAAVDREPVMTGHAHGQITVNLAEADDAYRERLRTEMHEPYRTPLGQCGTRPVDRRPHWVEPFPRLLRRRARRLRGGARRPLRQRRAGAVGRVVYQRVRSVHPWEDWSETCAHYLHMIDTLDTAPAPVPACGLALLPDCPREPSLTDQTPVDEASFENPIKRWFP